MPIGGVSMFGKKPAQQVYTRDLSELLKNVPPGAWVALSHDKTSVLGFGSSMKAAALQAELKGESNPILLRMPIEGEGIAAGVR